MRKVMAADSRLSEWFLTFRADCGFAGRDCFPALYGAGGGSGSGGVSGVQAFGAAPSFLDSRTGEVFCYDAGHSSYNRRLTKLG
jgi:hypothetical protein